MESGPGAAGPLAELLAEANPLLEAVVNAVPEPFFVLDRDGRYLAVFGGRHKSRYHDGAALVGRTLHEVMPNDVADGFLRTIHRVLETGEGLVCHYELGADDVDGVEDRDGVPTRLSFEGHVAPIERADGPPEAVVWMPFNITELRRALAELEGQRAELYRLANTDGLTGIRNRRSFLEAARHELATSRRSRRSATLMLLDLDRFKGVNDTGGHAAGDRVLEAVARLLRSDRRESDVVARLGGEEFAVLLTDTPLEAGEVVAQRLRSSLAELEVHAEGQRFRLTTSIGITPLVPQDDITDAMIRADTALYRAKANGRDRVEVELPPE
ncbi:sensor domain-containing diguanylate cyclase [Actinomarinicola tropica]|uniref:Diguanylate cyclase n=1 Tax=Actinomarinicola tropica TaxID=2789776 RepID=A0A5Q2RGI6_9ACTN|nr:GGDEF domain-containing protein [Actinomarinicola tropica]QGG95929.1 diguanylate cyclase [Actinomarinicola tropica]